MVNTVHPLGPVEYAILGLVRIAPRHGYDLVDEFKPQAELGEALRVDMSNLYAALKRLERRGLVTSVVEGTGPRPPRHVFYPTPTGEAEFNHWLTQPVRQNRNVRLDFVLKLYFTLRLAPERFDALLARQLAAALDSAQQIRDELDDQPAGSFGWILRQMRLSAVRGTISWLEAVRDVEPGQRSTAS